MPKFLEDKLKAEYPNNPHAVFGTMNAIGAMHGNQETAKGAQMEAKHIRDVKAGVASGLPKPRRMTHMSMHPSRNLGKWLHPKKTR